MWNWGIFVPVAQMSDRTAFLLESEAAGARASRRLRAGRSRSNRVIARSIAVRWTWRTGFASGPGEQIDAEHYDWDWQSETGASAKWVAVTSPMRDAMHASVNEAHSADTTGDYNWGLVPDALPHTEYAPTSAGEVVRIGTPDDEQAGWSSFPEKPLTLPPGTSVHLLLDRKTLTTAYPIFTVSGGEGANIRLTYSEALYDEQMHKGDRDEVGDRQAEGFHDTFLPDGGQHRTFEPLWWRTWRYLALDIETAGEPLTLESLTAAFTAYPFEERANSFRPIARRQQIWDVSWRTARLDAHETYMDTPY